MDSILTRVSKLRDNKPIMIDYHNSNRYCLLTQENDGTKTAYCFSTPIYNCNSRKVVDFQFHTQNGEIYAVGSNANITVADRVQLKNAEGACYIALPQKPTTTLENELRCENDVLFATTNGVALKTYIKESRMASFVIEVEQPFMNVRANDKYFALLRGEFKPFVTISCIGTLDTDGNVIAPATIQYQKLNDRKYQLTILPQSPLGTYVLLECNLYERKLFQDTTVESANPETNNAFGSTAFIGNSDWYGEQWLYSRLDCERISNLWDKQINRAILHLPKYNMHNVELSAFQVSARFCSFGSNWNNKIAGGNSVSHSVIANGYQSIDVTALISDSRTKSITRSEGLILKSKVKGSGFSAIATGDSYFAPQILEINFR